jgi:hypothetical protein
MVKVLIILAMILCVTITFFGMVAIGVILQDKYNSYKIRKKYK